MVRTGGIMGWFCLFIFSFHCSFLRHSTIVGHVFFFLHPFIRVQLPARSCSHRFWLNITESNIQKVYVPCHNVRHLNLSWTYLPGKSYTPERGKVVWDTEEWRRLQEWTVGRNGVKIWRMEEGMY